MSDATFARIATLADELDAGIVIDRCTNRQSEIERIAVAAHGVRPIERLEALGLLTPALTAVHMAHASAADIELAQRTRHRHHALPRVGLLRGGRQCRRIAAFGGGRVALEPGQRRRCVQERPGRMERR